MLLKTIRSLNCADLSLVDNLKISLKGSFTVYDHILSVSSEKHKISVDDLKSIAKDLAGKRTSVGTERHVLSYLMPTKGKGNMLIGLDERRLSEVTSNDAILKSLPDPLFTIVFADLKLYCKTLTFISFECDEIQEVQDGPPPVQLLTNFKIKRRRSSSKGLAGYHETGVKSRFAPKVSCISPAKYENKTNRTRRKSFRIETVIKHVEKLEITSTFSDVAVKRIFLRLPPSKPMIVVSGSECSDAIKSFNESCDSAKKMPSPLISVKSSSMGPKKQIHKNVSLSPPTEIGIRRKSVHTIRYYNKPPLEEASHHSNSPSWILPGKPKLSQITTELKQAEVSPSQPPPLKSRGTFMLSKHTICYSFDYPNKIDKARAADAEKTFDEVPFKSMFQPTRKDTR